MKILNKPNNTCFGSYYKVTEEKKGNNNLSCCISESHFMRNLDSGNFAVDYITKTFPNGGNIVIHGSSQLGGYTFATLFHPSNKDKKYRITSFDIVPEVIEDAKLGVLNIGICNGDKLGIPVQTRDNDEVYLIESYRNQRLTQAQIYAKRAFEECFDKVPDSWRHFNVFHPNFKRKVEKRLVEDGENPQLTIKRLEYMHLPKRRDMKSGLDFIPKKGVFDNVLDFRVDDITKISTSLKENSVEMVSFQNALYHILGAEDKSEYRNFDASPVENLFKEINKVLKKDGIFVLGNLRREHLISSTDDLRTKCIEFSRKGQELKVDDSPIHQLLFKSGFEPIYYEFTPQYKTLDFKQIGIRIPTVWKKIRHI